MKTPLVKKLIRFVMIALYLAGVLVTSACEQVPGSEQEFDSNVLLFPSGFFNAGYTETYAITGTNDNSDNVYTGSFTIQTGEQTVFDGISAIPVVTTLSYRTVINNNPTSAINIILTEYFSVETPRHYLGSQNSKSLVIRTAQEPVPDIPLQVFTTAMGQLGQFIGSDSSLESISWAVNELDAGHYQISINVLDTDSAGTMLSDETQTFTVTADGERTDWSLVSVVADLNTAFHFSGTRQ